MRKMLLMLLLLLSLTGTATAQENTPSNPFETFIQWGEDMFPFPEWAWDFYAQELLANGTWTASGENGGLVVNYQINFGIRIETTDDISAIVDDEWLEVALGGYQGWEEAARCTTSDFLLIELDTMYSDSDYLMRYWFWSEEDTFHAVLTAYPAVDVALLDAVSETLFPDLPTCKESE